VITATPFLVQFKISNGDANGEVSSRQWGADGEVPAPAQPNIVTILKAAEGPLR